MWSARYLDGASLPAHVQAACTQEQAGGPEKHWGQLLAAFTPLLSAVLFLSEMKLSYSVKIDGQGFIWPPPLLLTH